MRFFAQQNPVFTRTRTADNEVEGIYENFRDSVIQAIMSQHVPDHELLNFLPRIQVSPDGEENLYEGI